MMVVGSFIPFALVQLHDSVSQVFRQGMRRFSTPVLMYNPFFSLLKNPGFDPVHLSNAEPQQHSGFTSGDLLMKETLTANRLTSFLLMVIVFSPITDIFSDALWDDNITDAQHPFVTCLTKSTK